MTVFDETAAAMADRNEAAAQVATQQAGIALFELVQQRPGWGIDSAFGTAQHIASGVRVSVSDGTFMGVAVPYVASVAGEPARVLRFAHPVDAVLYAERAADDRYTLAQAEAELQRRRCRTNGHALTVRTHADGSPAYVRCTTCPDQWHVTADTWAEADPQHLPAAGGHLDNHDGTFTRRRHGVLASELTRFARSLPDEHAARLLRLIEEHTDAYPGKHVTDDGMPGRLAICVDCSGDGLMFVPDQAEAQQRYDDAIARGLSEYEAREEGWPTQQPDPQPDPADTAAYGSLTAELIHAINVAADEHVPTPEVGRLVHSLVARIQRRYGRVRAPGELRLHTRDPQPDMVPVDPAKVADLNDQQRDWIITLFAVAGALLSLYGNRDRDQLATLAEEAESLFARMDLNERDHANRCEGCTQGVEHQVVTLPVDEQVHALAATVAQTASSGQVPAAPAAADVLADPFLYDAEQVAAARARAAGVTGAEALAGITQGVNMLGGAGVVMLDSPTGPVPVVPGRSIYTTGHMVDRA